MAGILLSTRGERVMSPTTRLQAHATWEFLDFLANSLLFLLMGLAVRTVALTPGEQLVRQLVVALMAVVLARVVVVRGTARAMAARGRPLPAGWGPVLVWAGLRGAVSLAAALSLPVGLADHDLLIVLTFGVVLFTLLAQGLTVAPLLRRLGLVETQPAPAVPDRRPPEMPPLAGDHVDDRLGALGPVLDLAARDQELDEAELAHWLEATPDVLEALRRQHCPDPSDPDYQQAVQAVGRAAPCNTRVLQAIVRSWWALGLVWPLRAYQRRCGLSDAELAAYLEISTRQLERLGHQLRLVPGSANYAAELELLAEEAGCNAGRLAALLAEAGILDPANVEGIVDTAARC